VTRRAGASLAIATVVVLSSLTVFGLGSGATVATGTSHAMPDGPSDAASPAPPQTALPAACSTLNTASNDPGYAGFVRHVAAIARSASADGLPSVDLHLPYAGPIPDQTVAGVAMSGSQLSAECGLGLGGTSQATPTGVAYDGQIDMAGVHDLTLDSNSIAGVLTVDGPTQNFYPGSGTPTVWGAQENVVLPNVTILGARCPNAPCSSSGVGNYAFWVQNTFSYDSHNDSLYFVDDTWNFTSFSSAMYSSSLVRWSPNGGNYTGVWVAFSRYYYVPPPFTVTMYVNSSVDAAGDQVLWYNYSVATPTRFIGDGNYDYLVFDSQAPGHHRTLRPPDFEASASVTHIVTEGYEFDAFIGADDGSNQLMLGAHATMQVQYCDRIPYCTPTAFHYANVPAAVNFGSQTGEQGIGIAVDYSGTTAYLSGGPLINHGLWNFTGTAGVLPGVTRVVNAVRVAGDPEGPLRTQPYVFVFFESKGFATQGFQWAPDVPAWYLMPGTYHYEIQLADYLPVNGTIVVGSTPTTLAATLHYDPRIGVYTPLWAFGNGELAGISSSGSGSIAHQYVPFHNPTAGSYGFRAGNLSSNFFSANDYSYPSFPGVLLYGTNAYVDLADPPSFSVGEFGGVDYYLGIEFYTTSHVTLSDDANVQGWPAWSEISFYLSVPASQNPVPEADVFVWNSTRDLIRSNDFTSTASAFGVAPDGLVLYGGTKNVVWGNSFVDPPGSSLSLDGPYAGIGLGESGDLIYNNNFSVDNPVVYLPYNWVNTADCLPQTLGPCLNDANDNAWYYNVAANVIGNTWNVAPQRASTIANTVNGFPLSGNVLGPAIRTQGGNYYWNFGKSPNNYSTIPYVSRFYYSDWSNIFPLGCGSLESPGVPCGTAPPIVGAFENGIAVGGDYAPYGPTVIFKEFGLPHGTPWRVVLAGPEYTSTTPTLEIAQPYGTYLFSVASTGWSAHPSSGSVHASGAPTIVVKFTRDGASPSPGSIDPIAGTTTGWLEARAVSADP
jgi:hypothetical protein